MHSCLKKYGFRIQLIKKEHETIEIISQLKDPLIIHFGKISSSKLKKYNCLDLKKVKFESKQKNELPNFISKSDKESSDFMSKSKNITAIFFTSGSTGRPKESSSHYLISYII